MTSKLAQFCHIICTILVCIKYSEQGCVPPTDTKVGSVYAPFKEVYAYGEEITYECEAGYKYASGSLTRICNGLVAVNALYWGGHAPQCNLVECGEPDIPNAYYEAAQVTTYQSTISYRCNTGLAPVGYLTAECTVNATWSYTPCTKPEFHCPSPPEVSHARPNVSMSQQQSGTAIQYICDPGYELVEVQRAVICDQTTWFGELPTCEPKVIAFTPVQPTRESQPTPLNKNVLPIVAGAVTAVLLTAILTITVLCLRRRQRKPPQENPESEISGSPVTNSTQCQHKHLQHRDSVRSAGVGTLPRTSAAECVVADMTLPYHRIQCPHTHHSSVATDYCKQNYVPDSSLSHFRPLVSNYEHNHSSSPSTVQSEVSVTDSEFHTIRECLGDFKNNNLPNPVASSTPNTIQNPIINTGHNSNTMQHPLSTPHSHIHHINTIAHPQVHHHNAVNNGGRPCSTPFTRTLWTVDGRPYEAVTCQHGIEHVYQPLEHIYEEPHIWMRPLPDPQR